MLMTVFIGSRTKFRTRFGRPLGKIAVHMVADTKSQLHDIAAKIGLSSDDFHDTHYHVDGQYRYERAIAAGAKPRFGMYWTRVLERIQKRITEGKWDR
jgi:hypothetical protein